MAKEETGGLKLPIIDLYSSDKISTASDLRQACVEYGFFYLINHGVEEEFLKRVFDESMKFFSLPIKEKMKLARKDNRGYTPLYAEKLDSSSNHKGDSKENFDVRPFESISSESNLNQWPSEEVLPFWRATMESYSERILSAGKKLMSLIALALNLDEDFFEKLGVFSPPTPFLRLLHYPGKLGFPGEDIYGASPHSDYGMMTLLATDGVSGLQVCRDKFKQPMVWEDVPHINGALVVNIGDMTERWTNCLFQSTLHRVVPTGLERYSIALFLDPNPDCVVECLKSCCSESTPPRHAWSMVSLEEEFLKRVFDESMKFFSLPIKEKMKIARKDNRGYTPLYAEKLDSSSNHKGDSKEHFDVRPIDSISSQSNLNQWPSEEVLPSWRATMESYSERILSAGKKLVSMIALALNLDEDFFEKVGAFSPPAPLLRLSHYPGKLGFPGEDIYGASAHSDYGMITLLATDGVSGLQVCRDKFKQPMVWEDVPHINGALVVNIGDMTERWTNCLFQSTLHRVVPTGLERYSIALFMDPNPDCVVECLKSCCSESTPPRFPPVRSGDYLQERFRLAYSHN